MTERCETCNGSGYIHFDERVDGRLYCSCEMGKNVQKVEASLRSVVVRRMGGPATAEEIKAAPEWLRRITGYEG